MPGKTRVLFLAANPHNSSQLRLGEEIREVQSKIRAAEFREAFDLQSRWAVRPGDILQAFEEVHPHIVHFSGHGSGADGLVFENKDGLAQPVTTAALSRLFRGVKEQVRLVVLNACYSVEQADCISGEIDCTVGMSDAIGDRAAVVYAARFYGALAFGRSVAESHDQAQTELMLEGIAEEQTPVLLTRSGTDPGQARFVNRHPHNPTLPPLATEILQAAVDSNSAINFVRYDGGVAVLAGGRQFDSELDREREALLRQAVTRLVQAGCIKEDSTDFFVVLQAGYELTRRRAELASPRANGPPLLSEDARTLLLAAAEHPSGRVVAVRLLSGLRVSMGKHVFAGEGTADRSDARSQAQWQAVVEELEQRGFTRPGSEKREVFAVTAEGFLLADKLKAVSTKLKSLLLRKIDSECRSAYDPISELFGRLLS